VREIREFCLTKAKPLLFWYKESTPHPPKMVGLNHPNFHPENDHVPLGIWQKDSTGNVCDQASY